MAETRILSVGDLAEAVHSVFEPEDWADEDELAQLVTRLMRLFGVVLQAFRHARQPARMKTLCRALTVQDGLEQHRGLFGPGKQVAAALTETDVTEIFDRLFDCGASAAEGAARDEQREQEALARLREALERQQYRVRLTVNEMTAAFDESMAAVDAAAAVRRDATLRLQKDEARLHKAQIQVNNRREEILLADTNLQAAVRLLGRAKVPPGRDPLQVPPQLFRQRRMLIPRQSALRRTTPSRRTTPRKTTTPSVMPRARPAGSV